MKPRGHSENKPSNVNSSVQRAVEILEHLATLEQPNELSVISKNLRMNKSTVYRFLSTLEGLGYVRQDSETGRYSLGSKVVWLASRYLDTIDLRNAARPIIKALMQETGETIHLAILDNLEVVYIDKIDGAQPVVMSSRIGSRMPAHSTGIGKALLANQGQEKWIEYVTTRGLKACTSNTIIGEQDFYRHMQLVVEQGYSIDNCENEDGIRCVAAPIQDFTGKVVAAISISGWIMSMTSERALELAPVSVRAAREISERLGWMSKSSVP